MAENGKTMKVKNSAGRLEEPEFIPITPCRSVSYKNIQSLGR
jgi:hypothetical protein